MLRVTLAALHLIALGIGLGAVWARARALNEQPLTIDSARRAFAADTWWGFAAGLWIATGLWRLLAGTEKQTSYYMQNHIFFAKMGFLVLILALEMWPMITLFAGVSPRGDWATRGGRTLRSPRAFGRSATSRARSWSRWWLRQ